MKLHKLRICPAQRAVDQLAIDALFLNRKKEYQKCFFWTSMVFAHLICQECQKYNTEACHCLQEESL